MKLFARYFTIFILLPALLFVFASIACIAEEAPKLTLSCDGKFEHNRTEHFATLEKNVKLSYADMKLDCQYLRVNFEDDDTMPKSIEARGYLDESDIREKASGRIHLEWGDIRLSAQIVTCAFHAGTEKLHEVSADGDVWMRFEERGYTVHCGHLGLSFDKEGVSITALMRPDASVSRVELGGNGFVATELEGFITYTKDSFIHTGREIEITYDLTAGRAIISEDIRKLQAEKLTVNAGTFDISPFANRFKFGDGVKVRFGEFVLKCASLDLETTKDNRLPRRIVAARGKSICEMGFRGMALKAATLDVAFDEDGALSSFNAINEVDIVVVDTSNREIRAQGTRAVYSPNLVTLHGEPWVHIQIPSEKTTIREKKCEFFLREGRWEHRGEGIEVEAAPDGIKK